MQSTKVYVFWLEKCGPAQNMLVDVFIWIEKYCGFSVKVKFMDLVPIKLKLAKIFSHSPFSGWIIL